MQSALATTRLRLLPLQLSGGLRLLDRERELLIPCGDGTILQAFHSAQDAGCRNSSRGLVVLLHGWHGSSSSTYMLTTGEHLHRAGYDVVRINLRDHGDTAHLNDGVFHANLLEEVAAAVRRLAGEIPHRSLFVVGFSLGGNFALRLALDAPKAGLELDHVVAVNPPLDPSSALEAIDRSPLYRRYFVSRWREALMAKQQAFPQRYDFEQALRIDKVVSLTEEIVLKHTPFRTMEDYFDGYDLTREALVALSVPVTVVTSEDDPIIDVGDFRKLVPSAQLKVEIHPQGGHCGYIEGPMLRPWLEQRILETLQRSRERSHELLAACG